MKRSEIRITKNKTRNALPKWKETFRVSKGEEVRKFHASFPEYRETPLVKLDSLAAELGVRSIVVKDESYRFGLNAFKGLGGSYCIANYIAGVLNCDISKLDYNKITSPEVREKIKDITFVTATDGNHGRGIAWTAGKLGVGAKVFLPKVSTQERLEHIRALGADAEITEFNYDDTVRYAKEYAEAHGWPLVQDTAWEGYEEIPSWIMQGYLTMIVESVKSLENTPTHIFLQAGVGAMAGAVTGFLANYYGNEKPIITIVEPDKADCIYATALANDGKLHSVNGDLNTIMAGLACGEPCTLGWDLLSAYADFFVSIPDSGAAKGMRMFANPLQGDCRIISGESGAAPFGFVCEILENDEMADIKEMLGINENSRLFFISTEGDTDRQSYRRIVWNGQYPSV